MTGDFLECSGKKKNQFGFKLPLMAIKELKDNADILSFQHSLREYTFIKRVFVFQHLRFMSCVVTNYLVLLQLMHVQTRYSHQNRRSLVRMLTS